MSNVKMFCDALPNIPGRKSLPMLPPRCGGTARTPSSTAILWKG